MFDIKEQLKILPDSPGVYIMKDLEGTVIYVGKAISLKNRVRQYFQSAKHHPPKVRAMVVNIVSFEYILTDSELEALILECNLIKKYKPKYNILLRDDKTYPYIKVTLEEEYPRIIKTRKVKKDKGKYFGPYTNVGALNEAIDIIHQMYPIRTCKKNISKMIERRERPCLNYHIKKCMGPCRGVEGKEQYQQMIQEIILLLNGKEEELVKRINEKMKEAAKKLDFEKAAYYRDQLQALENTLEKQKIVSTNMIDQDVIAAAIGKDLTCVQVFMIREGKLVHREHFLLATQEETKEEILSSFIKQYYMEASFIPKEVFIEKELEDQGLIEEWLSKRKDSRVRLKTPVRGEKKQMMELVAKNALMVLAQNTKLAAADQAQEEVLLELQELLQLEEYPLRLEAYDISNMQGLQSVGSMVVFENGKPSYKDYRRFKIKTIIGPNDYGSLEEIIERRFRRGLAEAEEVLEGKSSMKEGKFSVFPDVIMMDGGIGQVNSALKVLGELSIDIPVCGMVKDDKHRTKGLVYNGVEIILDKSSKLYRLISKLQDEVHRFAIEYHKSLRKKDMLQSQLEEIAGVGEARRKALIKHFKDIQKIKEASIEELQGAEGISRKVAEAVFNHFRLEKDK